MQTSYRSTLKILTVLESGRDAEVLQTALESTGHIVRTCSDFAEAKGLLLDWRPDLLIAGESLGRGQCEAGLRLAEYNRDIYDQLPGRFRTQVVLLIPLPDRDRWKRAQSAGAHAILQAANFDAVVRYIDSFTDELATDRVLGPVLFGTHVFRGRAPDPDCSSCRWIGASVSYGLTEADVQLTPVRETLLCLLMLHRRGLTSSTMVQMIERNPLLEDILGGHLLKETAVRMEVTRLRGDITRGLSDTGAPCDGSHFLPLVRHGVRRYRLAGNWHLVHRKIES